MSFKTKNKIKKDSYFDNRVTLDRKYKEKNLYFQEQKDSLESKKNELSRLNNLYNKYDVNSKLSDKKIEEKMLLKEKINTLEKNIDNIQHKKDDINYLLDTGKILFEYYSDPKKENVKSININDYFKQRKTVLNKNSKANIYEKYQNKLYELSKVKNNNINVDYCLQCNIEKKLYISCGKLICEKCGEETPILIDSDKPSYKDPPREVCYFAYKRINHFNEWLAQFQAKETTQIPENIYRDIYNELQKNINLDLSQVTYKQIRDVLKKLKYNKYYDNIPHLINIISNKKAPQLNRESEEMLRSLFKEIQLPFMKHCPPTRKNFLSYSYVLHKFCELLEYDHLLCFFPLLKSREKLQQQDQIWKKICEELKWEYIPSA